MNNKMLHMVAFILLIVGGLNWLLVAFGFNLVDWLFIDILGMEIVARVVYILVGLAAAYEVLTHKQNCRMCESSAVSSSAPAGSGMA